MSLYSGGLIIGRMFASDIWGYYVWESLYIFWGGGGAYYRNFTVFQSGGQVIRMLVAIFFFTKSVKTYYF